MKPELSIIKAFLNYEVWLTYSENLTSKSFPEDLQLLYRTLDSWHKTNEHKVNLSLLDLANLFFANHPKDKEFYEEVFNTLEKNEVNLDTTKVYITSLRRASLLREASIKAYEVAEGKLAFEKFLPILDGLREEEKNTEQKEEIQYVTTDLDVLVNTAVKTPGLRWRLNTLNRMLGSLRKGDFGFVFARPETGKTTFLSDQVSYMLTQTDGDILWFNNEEQHEKVVLRVYQAFFGVTLAELLANIPKYQKAFQEATQGRFKLPNISRIDRKTVEKILGKTKPALILADQLDKFEGFDADREDLILGAKYQWAREIAKEYAPFIGICQSDGSGENQKWLTMANVANAKTAKQAEADWILGIGKIHDTGWEQIRFLHLSKNKLIGDLDTDPKMRHGKQEVLIEPEIARYRDMK